MAHNLFDLRGKVALIAGSSHGLGFAIARGLGQAGATLVLAMPSMSRTKRKSR